MEGKQQDNQDEKTHENPPNEKSNHLKKKKEKKKTNQPKLPELKKIYDESLMPEKDPSMIRFIHISDTHGYHNKLDMPQGDV